ncbi:MAG: 50S ribosomal protein L25 [Patescibacteria group bacterium]|nr:50S ribosomal protein L25 [Patescibacteria group bacterium]
MLVLSAVNREILGKKVKILREKGVLPGVLYGPKIKTIPVEIDLKEFEKIYKEAGESSLISLSLDKKKYSVLIYDVKKDALSGELIHVDFYQPSLEEKVETEIPIVIDGESPAVQDLGGTLIKNISEVKVKALPQDLPKEIKVNVEALKTLDDDILIKDLIVSENIEVLGDLEEVVVSIARQQKVEEELEKPIEEKVEDVEKGEKKREKEEEKEEGKGENK